MTISSYEVSATLLIADRASATLEKVLGLTRQVAAEFEKVKLLGKDLFAGTGIQGFSNKIVKLSPALAEVTAGMDKVKIGAISGLRDMDSALDSTTAQVAQLRRELAETAAVTRDFKVRNIVPAGGGGRGRSDGGEGEGGIHASGRAPIPFVPGAHMSTSMGVGLIAGGATAYGAYEEAVLRDTTARMLFLSGQPMANMAHQDLFKAIRKQLLDVYTMTGADLEDIEEAGVSSVKLMAGFPIGQRMDVMKTALTFGAQEHRLNPQVSVSQGADALIGLLHQTGTYDPKLIQEFTPKIAALSTITNMPLSRVMTAAGYSMPIASANLGVDSDTILLLMTAMQRAGVTNTKSGTWLREAITKTITDTFTLSKFGADAQKEGLKSLGLIDAKGQSTVIDGAGHLDLMKELEILGRARDQLKGPEYLQAMRKAFGVQGSEGMAVLTEPQVIQQLPQLREWMTQMPGGQEFFKDMFGASPEQQGKATLAEFNRSLMDVGSTALPAVTDALTKFDAGLKGLNTTLEKAGVPDASKVTSWGLLGGGALALSPWLRKTLGKLLPDWGELKATTATDGQAIANVAAKSGTVPSEVANVAAKTGMGEASLLGPLGALLAVNMQHDLLHKGPDGRYINPEFDAERAWMQNHVVAPIKRIFGVDQPTQADGIEATIPLWLNTQMFAIPKLAIVPIDIPDMPKLPTVSLALPDMTPPPPRQALDFAPPSAAQRSIEPMAQRGSERRDDNATAAPAMSDEQADHIGTMIVTAMKQMFGQASLNIDGRKLGKLLFADMGRDPPSGGDNFDTRLAPLYPATGFK